MSEQPPKKKRRKTASRPACTDELIIQVKTWHATPVNSVESSAISSPSSPPSTARPHLRVVQKTNLLISSYVDIQG
jgi:hypothetical protein